MTFSTLMTHLISPDLDEDFLLQVGDLAGNFSAHLDVICHGVDRMTAGFYYGGVDPVMMQCSLQSAMEDAQDMTKGAQDILKKTSARWSVEACVSPLGNLNRSVGNRARFTDLTVVQTPYGNRAEKIDCEAVLEGALFAGQSPTLIIPDGVAPQAAPKTIIIGWNESAEAMNAVRAAMPLLKQANQVRVTVIDPPRHGQDRSDPGGPLSVFLARHGVKAEIDVLGQSLPRVCDVLLRHARDKNADLVVMGAYGHSRFREAILGGATRDMLEEATLPVLMMH